MSLYVNFEKKKNQRIFPFLKDCFSQSAIEEHNPYALYHFCRTYNDEICSDLQSKNANRSIEMIYEVVKTYYPNCSIEHFFKQLNRLFKKGFIYKGNKHFPHLLFCPTVNKWVIQIMNITNLNWKNNKNILYLWDYNLSSTKLSNPGNGTYTYVQIMNNMGYSQEEYIKA